MQNKNNSMKIEKLTNKIYQKLFGKMCKNKNNNMKIEKLTNKIY